MVLGYKKDRFARPAALSEKFLFQAYKDNSFILKYIVILQHPSSGARAFTPPYQHLPTFINFAKLFKTKYQ
jgi:hypothetical protein